MMTSKSNLKSNILFEGWRSS